MLFFSNKTDSDIILRKELTAMLNSSAVYVITDERSKAHYHGFINKQFLKEHIHDFSKHFYLCGPPKMSEAILHALVEFGASADAVVFEK